MVDSRLLGKILDDYSPHFSGLGKKHQNRMITLIQQFLKGDRKHKKIQEMKYLNSQYLSSKELKKRFSGKGSYYLDVIKPYFDCVDETYQKGKYGYTKKYELKDWLLEKVETYLNVKSQITISRISNNEKEIENLEGLSNNGVSSNHSNIYLPSTLDVNTPLLDYYINQVEKKHYMFGDKNPIKRKIRFQLLSIRKHLNNTLKPNKLIQLYNQHNSGRFFPTSGCGLLHPIQMKSDIRNILFSEMDMYYYDISNSHLSIMYHLGLGYGIKGDGIKYYLDNKVDIRNKWLVDYGLPKITPLKKYIISWIYGNNNNEIYDNPFYKKLGYDRLYKIKHKDDVLISLFKDVNTIKKVIVKNVVIKDGKYMNVWNLGLPIYKYGVKTKPKKILPHILFGYESKIMETINTSMDSDMKVLVYDGYIGKKNSVKKMNNLITNNLGLDIKFDVEKIKPPIQL